MFSVDNPIVCRFGKHFLFNPEASYLIFFFFFSLARLALSNRTFSNDGNVLELGYQIQ